MFLKIFSLFYFKFKIKLCHYHYKSKRTNHVLSLSIDTTLNYRQALELSEVILLMAEAQPNKVILWDTAIDPRPIWFTGLKYRFGWWRIMLFDVNDN